MALTVTGITRLTATDAITGWTDIGGGGGSSINTEVQIEGTGCLGRKVSNSVKGMIYDNGSGIDMTGRVFRVWVNVTSAGKLAAIASGGIAIRLCTTSATADYNEYYVAGSDTYTGGWKSFIIAPTGKTASATNGTFSLTNVRYFGVIFNVASTVSGGDNNCYIDALDYYSSLDVDGTSTAFWADLLANDLSNVRGIIREVGGVYFVNALVNIGDDGTATTDVEDTSEVIVFEDPKYHNGTSLVSANNTATLGLRHTVGASQAFNVDWGTKIGTGDASVGLEGMLFLNGGTLPWTFDLSDADMGVGDTANFYGCTMRGMTTSTLTPTSGSGGTFEYVSCSFDACDTIEPGIRAFGRRNIVQNSVAVSAFHWDLDPLDWENSSFLNNDRAVLIDTVDTYDFTQISFSGNTFDVRNNSAGAVTINVLNGDTPTVENLTTSTTTVNNQISHTLTGIEQFSEVTYVRISDGAELFHVESVGAGGSTTYNYNYVSDVAVRILINSLDFENLEIETTLTNTDASIPVSQQDDRIYSNP